MSLSFEDTQIAFEYRNNKDLRKAHFLFKTMGSPKLTAAGISLTNLALKLHLPIKSILKSTIYQQFCGGETLEEAAHTSEQLAKYNVGVALDYGVEGKESEADFEAAVPEFVRAIELAATEPSIPFIPIKLTGFCRFALMEKIHAKETLSEAETQEWDRVKHRIDVICKAAHDNQIRIIVDAEETWIQDPIDELCDELSEKYNHGMAIVYNTFQQYATSRYPFLEASYKKAAERGYILGAKIVRGAYMEKERARAAEKGYPSPINVDKAATDEQYNKAIDFCLDHLGENLHMYMGTHNEDSCMRAVKHMESKGIAPEDKRVFIAQLYGMSDNITFNLAHAGYNANKYLPYGPILDVVPYLFRRAQENTSVAGQTGRELALLQKEMKRRGLIK